MRPRVARLWWRILSWWRRAGLATRLSLFGLGSALFIGLIILRLPEEEPANIQSGVQVFLLFNVTIILVLVLAFLVGRNLVKLILDRRRNIFGARLRSRLVGAFVGLTLGSALLLLILASGQINRAIEGWFNAQIENAVNGAVKVARVHYRYIQDNLQKELAEITRDLTHRQELLRTKKSLTRFLERKRRARGLFRIQVYNSPRSPLAEAKNIVANLSPFREPPPDRVALKRAFHGRDSFLFEDFQSNQFVRGYVPLVYKRGNMVVVGTIRVESEMTHALALVHDSYQEYEQLKTFQGPIRSNYFMKLGLWSGVIVFTAIWAGFYLAREITVPLEKLAEGTLAVARGDYRFRVAGTGDDEIGQLIRSFNQMASDLDGTREEGEGRRLFIEAILTQLAIGVIALDKDGAVTSMNRTAMRLFDVEVFAQRPIEEVLGRAVWGEVRGLLHDLSGPRESEFSMLSAGQEKRLVCTVGPIVDTKGDRIGTLLLFDDITELTKAESLAAWREVARRIAHEIKNPLTPIRLSAQRLEKLLGNSAEAPAVRESTQAIVESVDSIKRLTDEFSNFARMPVAELKSTDLQVLVQDIVNSFSSNNPNVLFRVVGDTRLPKISLDPELIRRALINLVDNSLAATLSASGGEAPRIIIRMLFNPARREARVEISDNGPGIPDGDKLRIFEPYFTTKSVGTGLGLAVVSTIMADHQGRVSVHDNQPRGATFVLEMPVEPSKRTRRRFG